MSSRERLRRADPERTEPLRQWSNLYRAPDSWNLRDAHGGDGPEHATEPEESWSDVVAEGVAVGYRVIEEQIRQGQRVAEEMSGAAYGPAAMGGDLRESAERVVRYSADLVALWLDFVNATFGNGDLLRSLAAAWPPGAGAPAPTAAGASAFAVEISSTRPLRVSCELKPGFAGRALATHGLHALEVDKPPLTEVTLEPGGAGAPLSLRVRIPPGQPPGLYTGVIVDRQSGEPLGTLSARLSE